LFALFFAAYNAEQDLRRRINASCRLLHGKFSGPDRQKFYEAWINFDRVMYELCGAPGSTPGPKKLL
jgi:hypothetical protein